MVLTRSRALVETQKTNKGTPSKAKNKELKARPKEGLATPKRRSRSSEYDSQDSENYDSSPSKMKKGENGEAVFFDNSEDENIPLKHKKTGRRQLAGKVCGLEGRLARASISSDGHPLSGREKEYATLLDYLGTSINSLTSISMYISGPPGSGKTATVTEVLKHLSYRHKKLRVVFVNCVSSNKENDVYRDIYDRLGFADKAVAVSKLQTTIEGIFQKSKDPIMIVLDEVDGVKSKSSQFHYNVFQWPARYESVSLIGIANSLDLTERVLRKLKLLRPPQILTFAPYEREILQKIIKEKLASETAFEGSALELCSRKVAAMTGDVRTAIQVAQQMLSAMEEETGTNNTPSTPISCARALSTLSNVYSSAVRKAHLPYMQKILLATILRLTKAHSTATIDKSVLQSSYTKICNEIIGDAVSNDGLYSTLSLLEAQNLIECKPTTCCLLVDSSEAKALIQEALLNRVLGIPLD